jgi:hypothetical protein
VTHFQQAREITKNSPIRLELHPPGSFFASSTTDRRNPAISSWPSVLNSSSSSETTCSSRSEQASCGSSAFLMDVAWHLDEVLSIELDGFAYADSYEDDRFVGLTVTKPTAVRP